MVFDYKLLQVLQFSGREEKKKSIGFLILKGVTISQQYSDR